VKSAEVPKPVAIGIIAVIVVIVAFFMYNSFMKAPPQVEASKLSPERLSDPDRPRGSTTGPSGAIGD
jgi:hypothetical protein